jgi:AcrR family transcriptional regulator
MKHEYDNIDVKNEKANSIIRAAFEVFSLNDKEKASTNSVVKKAGISRGLLYHYFKDKQDLFDFLVYFSVKEMVTTMKENLDWEDRDYLNRIRQVITYKFAVMDRYPYMLEFFDKYSREITRVSVRDHVEEISPGMGDKIYTHNLDYNLVKPGVDIDKMKQVVRHTLTGMVMELWNEARARGDSLGQDEVMRQCDEFIQFFREQFYNQPGGSR